MDQKIEVIVPKFNEITKMINAFDKLHKSFKNKKIVEDAFERTFKPVVLIEGDQTQTK